MEPTHNNSPPPDNNRHTTTPQGSTATAAITAASVKDGLNSGPREPNELENGLASEAAQLDDEQTEALIYLLQQLREQGLPLNAATARGCVGGAKQMMGWLAVYAKVDEQLQEQHRQRDSLPEPEKILFVCDALKERWFYKAPLQRTIIKRFLGQVAPKALKPYDKETVKLMTKRLEENLEGMPPELQQKVLQHYLENVLPDIEAEQEAEDDEQRAYEQLLEVLHPKTPEQVRAITQRLKAVP